MSSRFPPPYTYGSESFALDSTIKLPVSFARPPLFGLWKRRTQIDLPPIPEDAVAAYIGLATAAEIKFQKLSKSELESVAVHLGYLLEQEGSAALRLYLQALDDTLTKYALRSPELANAWLWPWVDVLVADSRAEDEYRVINSNFLIEPGKYFAQFRSNTDKVIDALRRPGTTERKLWLLEGDEPIAPFGESTTVTSTHVIIEYHDYADYSIDIDHLFVAKLSRPLFADAYERVVRHTCDVYERLAHVFNRPLK